MVWKTEGRTYPNWLRTIPTFCNQIAKYLISLRNLHMCLVDRRLLRLVDVIAAAVWNVWVTLGALSFDAWARI